MSLPRSRWLTVVSLCLLMSSSLIVLQDLTGLLWKREVPLTTDNDMKQEAGAHRFSLRRLDVPFPERLEADADVLEDGRPLNRVDFRNEITSSEGGCYVWTESSLWVVPRSEDSRNLVIRYPVVPGTRTKAIVFGATLLALIGVAASSSERKLWVGFLLYCAGAVRRKTSRASRVATDILAARPLLNDLIAILVLVLLGGSLYFPLVDRIAQSYDGFLISFLLGTGDLLPYNVEEVKEPGRPLVGLGWHIASALGNGSVSGYNAFMFVCLLLSSILVYAIVRSLLPRQPVWALITSVFKLVWIANFEIFDNSGLAIYFVETLFWLAVFLFVRLIGRDHPSRIEILSSAVMAACLVIVVGTYQTSWPVILMVPLSLLGLRVAKGTNRRKFILFSLWYVPALTMMAWCASISLSYANDVSPSFQELLKRVLAGSWAATGESLLYPFTPAPHPGTEMSAFAIAAMLGFAVLLVWFGLGSFPILQQQSSRRMNRAFLLLVLTGLAIVVGSLLPPALLYPLNFGTRFMHWAAPGMIIVVAAVLAWLFRRKSPLGAAMSVFLALVLFSSTFCRAFSVGNFLADNSLANRRFWEDLIFEIPKVKEGSVILMDGAPAGVALTDVFGTWALRALTETEDTFFISEAFPEFHPDTQSYEISSIVNLDPEGVMGELLGEQDYFQYPVFPTFLDEDRTFHIPGKRVIWVDWDIESRRLRIDPERSAMERIIRDAPSAFGEMLFPRAVAEKNRARQVK